MSAIIKTAQTLVPPLAPQTNSRFLPKAWMVGLLALLCYAITIGHGYVLDDQTVITNNHLVQEGTKSIGKLLKTGYWFGYSNQNVGAYRPLSLITFVIEKSLFGDGAAAHHFFNILCYAGLCMLLFRLLRRMVPVAEGWVAFAAIALFAVLPIHTEVVANIKSRDELLALLFGALSWLQFFPAKGEVGIGRLAGAAALFFLACLSKESILPLAVCIPLSIWFFKPKKEGSAKFSPVQTWVLLAAASFYLFIRWRVLTDTGLQTQHELINNSLIILDYPTRLATIAFVMGQYLILQLVPYRLSYDYSFNEIPAMHWADLPVLLSLAVHISLLAVAAWLTPKRNPIAFGIWFYFVMLSIASNIVVLIGAPMAERFVFAPSLGLCIAIAYGIYIALQRLPEVNAQLAGRVALGAAVLCYVPLTVMRAMDWVDNDILFTTDPPKVPNSARAQNDWGSVLILRGEKAQGKMQEHLYREGMAHVKRSLAIDPQYDACYQNLGYVYARLNQTDSALAQYVALRKVTPDHPLLEQIAPQMRKRSQEHSDIGTAYMQKGDVERARNEFKAAEELDPTNPSPAFNIGGDFYMKQQFDSAIVYWEKAARINPNNPEYQRALHAAKTNSEVMKHQQKAQ